VTGLLKHPNEMLAQFSLGIDDQDIRDIGQTSRTARPFRAGWLAAKSAAARWCGVVARLFASNWPGFGASH
jgi:hypothetical protein